MANHDNLKLNMALCGCLVTSLFSGLCCIKAKKQLDKNKEAEQRIKSYKIALRLYEIANNALSRELDELNQESES